MSDFDKGAMFGVIAVSIVYAVFSLFTELTWGFFIITAIIYIIIKTIFSKIGKKNG